MRAAQATELQRATKHGEQDEQHCAARHARHAGAARRAARAGVPRLAKSRMRRVCVGVSRKIDSRQIRPHVERCAALEAALAEAHTRGASRGAAAAAATSGGGGGARMEAGGGIRCVRVGISTAARSASTARRRCVCCCCCYRRGAPPRHSASSLLLARSRPALLTRPRPAAPP
jgi:hypothetical protein